jgi:hypothetical protein
MMLVCLLLMTTLPVTKRGFSPVMGVGLWRARFAFVLSAALPQMMSWSED